MMSKLERLLAELCPDGVEVKTLGEICTITRGNGLSKSDFTDRQRVRWVTLGEIATDMFRGAGIRRYQVTERASSLASTPPLRWTMTGVDLCRNREKPTLLSLLTMRS